MCFHITFALTRFTLLFNMSFTNNNNVVVLLEDDQLIK